ncbi:phospholipid/cholesterol/gamma-HCH transport system permease protein [Hymenobacter luteus]|uniref:Phospholipid/cholesterol/gamma-HCH transport system permease protein n=2 Tax=Hymenobacter TaxID=89966 RepID=A0A7W9SYX6_9BACT|nr:MULTISPECIES: ABC transporter permease [Hymenobacter]MBB4601307.1 phospholipid/cholesterol/gamma-HCH transport system permease protein [Hymenobacter latericoloratus]MBB6058486.1 phospholipid/cholesterol/gamma-HCH transport system permease protein [Hymenobacter luteus]RPD48419.1 ABC transporter permease [Hymenobacter sediminis]
MVKSFGEFLLFLQSMLTRKERAVVLWQRTLDECVIIGINSIFIVAIVSAFIGAVTCVQIAYNLTNPLIPKSTIGYMVREMTILELAPTITSIVLAGKVGSSIAGGLGTMRITEQVSALEVMGINSASYLVLPRILASMLMFPLLVILAMALSIIGGYLAGSLTGALSAQEYIEGIRTDFIPYNIVFALIKSVVFAFLVSAISSFKGFYTQGGALEVGAASTTAVNNSIIAILVADFALAALLL